MCIRDRPYITHLALVAMGPDQIDGALAELEAVELLHNRRPVSYTHLRAHETVLDLVCRLLL